MLSRCPGSAKCPVRTTRPHPLYYSTQMLLAVVCFQLLWDIMWGVGGFVVVGPVFFHFASPSPGPLLLVPPQIARPRGSGGLGAKPGRFSEGLGLGGGGVPMN